MLDTELQNGSQGEESTTNDSDQSNVVDETKVTESNDSNGAALESETEAPARDYEAEINRFKNQNNGLNRKIAELSSALQEMQERFQNANQKPVEKEQYKPFYERNLDGLSQREIGQLMIEEQRRVAQETVRQIMEEQEMSRVEAEKQAAQYAAAQKVNSVIEELRTGGMNDDQELKLRDYLRDNYHNLIKFAYNEMFGSKQKAEEARKNGEQLLDRIATASKNKVGTRAPNVQPRSVEKLSQKEREDLFDKHGPGAFINSN